MRATSYAASACLVLAMGLPLARAGDEPAAQERADRILCEDVLASPVTLEEAVREVAASGRVVLSARFSSLDDEPGLRLEVLSAAGERGADFQRRHGPVGREGWDARTVALEAPEDVARAARRHTLLSQTEVALDVVCARALEARDATGRRPSRLLSVEPTTEAGNARFSCTVAVDGLPWETTHGADGRLDVFRRPPYLEAREEAAKRWSGRKLPGMNLEHAVWLNVGEPVRLSQWRGSHVLVALTDPG